MNNRGSCFHKKKPGIVRFLCPVQTNAAKHDLKGKSAVLLIKERSHAVHGISFRGSAWLTLWFTRRIPRPSGFHRIFNVPGRTRHTWGVGHHVWITAGMGIPATPHRHQVSERGASIRKSEVNSGSSNTCMGHIRARTSLQVLTLNFVHIFLSSIVCFPHETVQLSGWCQFLLKICSIFYPSRTVDSDIRTCRFLRAGF